MEYRKITHNDDWRELWLGKFSAEMKNRCLPEPDAKAHFTILSQYLTANTGNPREISVEKMKQFVKCHKAAAIPPLMLFYDAIAHSEKHCAALAASEIKQRKAKKSKKTSP
jgi:hypothetical protein